MGFVFEIILGLIILVILVVVHELGHAFQARRSGVVVEEFGVGLPPMALKKKLKNGILLTLNWLPLGGFVKLQGEYDAADGKGDYGAATFWQKTKILLAGVLVNWLFAALLLTGLAVTGLPKVISDQFSIPGDTTIVSKPVEIASLTKNHAAAKAGLKVGDKIIRFAGQKVPTVDRLVDLSQQNKGKEIAVIYNRDGVEKTTKVNLGTNSVSGIFGAGLGQRDLIKATWSAPIVGVATTAQFTWVTLQGLGDLIGSIASSGLKSVGDSVTGPIGIVGTIFPAAEQAGLTQLIFLTAIISLSLAVMNILPIPALDGGRWFTIVIFKLFKKQLTQEREEKIQAAGFYALMALTIVVTINDVAKLF
jgi:regulator of sigma E protease